MNNALFPPPCPRNLKQTGYSFAKIFTVSNSWSHWARCRRRPRIKSVADLDREVAAAAAAGKTAMLDFYADWCVSCLEMEEYTFITPVVQAALANTVVLQADVTRNDAEDKALLERFGVFGPPTIIFFGSDGQERVGYEVVGFMKAEDFAKHITRAFDLL